MNASEVARHLRTTPVFDPDNLLGKPDRDTLNATIKSLRERQLHARVVILAPDASLADYHSLWNVLGLDTTVDLLLLYNESRWEAKGWQLPQPTISQLLRAAEGELASNRGLALANVLSSLANAHTSETDAKQTQGPANAESSNKLLPIAGALATLGGFVWIVRRRARLAGQRRRSFLDATQSASKTYSDVVLAAEDLMSGDTAALQLRASELKNELDTLVSNVGNRPNLMARETTLGKIQHIENELVALQSTIMQKARS